jgi:hypothetical protein
MNVVVEIQVREALPVWTIPQVTGWALSPDMLLARLIKPDYAPGNRFPIAFNLGKQGQAVPIDPAQWVNIDNLISKLGNDLKASNLPSYDRCKAWKDRTIKVFWDDEPGYVWLDEFLVWYERFITSEYVSGKAVHPSPYLSPSLPKEHAEYFTANYAAIASSQDKHCNENPLDSKMLAETQKALEEIDCDNEDEFLEMDEPHLEFGGLEAATDATENVIYDCGLSQVNTEQQTESVANGAVVNNSKAVAALKIRKSKNNTDGLVLLNAALDEMEQKYNRTPGWTELAAYVLGDEFTHSNIQTPCDKGQAIKNRFHCLADGTTLTRVRIRRTYNETIYPPDSAVKRRIPSKIL